jgi:predicted secreted protein
MRHVTSYHGKNTSVLWSQFDLSSYMQEASVKQEVSTAETTTFGAGSRSYVAGLKDGTVSLSGFFDDTTTTGADVVLNTALGNATNPILTVGLAGATIGKRAKLAEIIETSYEITGNFDDAVTASVEMQVNGGVDNGIYLKGHAAETSSTNGAGQDGGAASTNGWVAHLHVTAMSTPTTLDVKVQHSTDNSTWADLSGGAFTQVTTSTTSQRLTGTGSVNRYTRYVSTIAGTSYTYAVAFARR